jgi:potassium efflux system protein
LAEAHFGWPVAGVKLLRHNLRWLLVVGLPLTFLVALLQHHYGSPHDSSLGRLAFIVGLVCLALFAARALRPIDPTAANPLIQQRAKLVQRFHAYWYPVAVSIPLALAGIAAWGYYYTALQLTWRLQATIWLIMGLLIVHSFLLRCVLVGRRRLAVQHARQLREQSHAHVVPISSQEGVVANRHDSHAAVETDATAHLDLSAIDTQNRRLLRTGCLVTLVVGSWLIWVDVLPALKFLDQWQLWQSNEMVAQTAGGDGQTAASTVLGTRWITVGDLATSIVIVLLTIVASRNLPGLLEIACLRRLPLDAGGRYALTSVSRYVITVVGLVAGCGAIGIGWQNVQWLAAAMTVGLGFGLQEIFANFVSGLIILVERPVRVGDTVTICGISGTVTRIRARATTISDADRKELIVPNKEFITGQLVNWTLTDPVQRMVIKVGVAYGSDPVLVTQLLLKAAHDQPEVLSDPAPSACFVDFGNSSLDFELRMYLAGLDKFSGVLHSCNIAIESMFREAGIEMAFPQQDIHIRTLPPNVSIADVPRLMAGQHVMGPQSKSA